MRRQRTDSGTNTSANINVSRTRALKFPSTRENRHRARPLEDWWIQQAARNQHQAGHSEDFGPPHVSPPQEGAGDQAEHKADGNAKCSFGIRRGFFHGRTPHIR
jgi:hypothetical protein